MWLIPVKKKNSADSSKKESSSDYGIVTLLKEGINNKALLVNFATIFRKSLSSEIPWMVFFIKWNKRFLVGVISIIIVIS